MNETTKAIARPLIAAALERGPRLYEADDILDACDRADMQLWCGTKSVLVTEIVHYPRADICIGVIASGDMTEVKAMTRDAERWAKEQGCTMTQLMGRDGWRRVFPEYKRQSMLWKEID